MADPIAWETGSPTTEGKPTLWVRLDEMVSTGMRVDEDGDYIVCFVVGFSGETRTLPELEDWIRRASAILDEL